MREKIKEFSNILKKGIRNGLLWIYYHKYRAISFVIALVLVVVIINNALKIKLKSDTIKAETSSLAEVIGQIELDAGKVLVHENNNKEMYIDSVTTNITVVDKETGVKWETLALNVVSFGSDGSVPESMTQFVSPFTLTYIRKDGTQGTINAYQYSIKDKDYEINLIKNGVQIIYRLQDKSIRVFEHLPRYISFERYEEVIDKRLEEALSEERLTERDVENFRTLWNVFYSKNTAKGHFTYSASTLPPTSSIRLMIRVLNTIGYDQDELIYDNAQYGVTTKFEPRTVYTIVMEVTLDGDDLVVKIPTGYSTSNNDYDLIKTINVFPNFGNVDSKSVISQDPGYIFVPDGSGALIQLNDYKVIYPSYSKPVYNNTAYDQFYILPNYEEQITMPVFGMYINQSDYWKGFLGIIENGQELAHINASVANRTSQASVNRVYASFDLIQISNIPLFGYYAEDQTSYLALSPLYDYDAVVRYKLLVKEKIDYYDFVRIYQNYLIERYNLIKNHENYEPKVFVDLIGNVTVRKRFLGIPYQSNLSMTTYNEAFELLKILGDKRLVVNYLGVVNRGINQSLISNIEFMRTNGKIEAFKELKEYVTRNGNELYVNIHFVQAYTSKNGFDMKKSLYSLANQPLHLRQFNAMNQRFHQGSEQYRLLSPNYLSDVVNRFIKQNRYFDSIAIGDLGHTYLVDYRKQQPVTPLDGRVIELSNLEKLANEYNIILDNPFFKNIGYADYLTNIRRNSSELYMFKQTIPFKQLVLNGLVEYSTETINIHNDKPIEYFILQAIELGSHPKFTLSYKDSSLIKDTEFNYYNSTRYDIWLDQIDAIYEAIVSLYQQIGCNEIVYHESLADNVFQTTYKNGTQVIVNYNLFEVKVNDFTLAPLGYKILKGGTQ